MNDKPEASEEPTIEEPKRLHADGDSGCTCKMPNDHHSTDCAKFDAEERCPTCGSDDPNICKLNRHQHPWSVVPKSVGRVYCCPDPFHQPPVEGEGDREGGSEMVNRWDVQPLVTLRAGFGYCPDPRCAEGWVSAVAHPDDSAKTLNRCPVCLSTVASDPAPSGEDGEEAVPLTLVRRGVAVGGKKKGEHVSFRGGEWWQEVPESEQLDSLRSVGYEVIEVVPASELTRVREERDRLRERLRRAEAWTE